MASVTNAGLAWEKVEGAPEVKENSWGGVLGGGELKGISCSGLHKATSKLAQRRQKKKENLSPKSSEFGGQVSGRCGK